jgi:NDP-sugar pyrophosphorylase family protein
MKAMVFAAGQGQRLRPITETIPKALVPVAGRAMIDYPLELLRSYGIHEVIINLHHLGEQIEAYLGNGERHGLKIRYSKEQELLDTGGGLLQARPFLHDQTFIVINTDVLIDLRLDELIGFHRQRRAAVTLVVRPDEDADRYGSLEADPEGRIYRFLSTVSPKLPPRAGEKLMFTGVQILEPRVFDFMNGGGTSKKFSTTKDTYPRMLAAGEPVYGFRFDRYWQDLGTEPRIREAERNLASGVVKLHFLSDKPSSPRS